MRQKLRTIWNKIRGPVPGLLIPAKYRRESVPTGPHIGVWLSLSEITDESATIEDYLSLLEHSDLIPQLINLAATNNLLGVLPLEPNLQPFLIERFVQPDYRDKISTLGKLDPGSTGRAPPRVVFDRVGTLTNLWALLAVSKSETLEKRDTALQMGELALVVNDFLVAQSPTILSQKVTEKVLMMESVITWEIRNPPELAYGLARAYKMLMRYLPSDDPLVVRQRDRLGIDCERLEYDTLSLGDFIAVVFGVHAHVKTISPDDAGKCLIEPEEFLSEVKLPKPLLDALLDCRGLSPEEYRDSIAGGHTWSTKELSEKLKLDQNLENILLIRRKPFVRLPDGRHVVLDVQFVADLLITGLYWTIFDDLKPEQREDFSSLWGRVFELYLEELLDHFYPTMSQILRTDIEYEGGQIDALLDFGEVVVVMEFKASLLSHKAKCRGDIKDFEEELRRKFVENEKGNPKAVRQLANISTALIEGKIDTAVKPKRVYPVLVALDRTLESLGVNQFLNDIFQGFLGDWAEPVVRPLSVVSVEELEDLLAFLEPGTLKWNGILEERMNRNRVGMASMHQAIFDHLRSHTKKNAVRNQWLLDEFERIYEEIVARY